MGATGLITAWLLVLVPATVALWFLAAFAFGLRRRGRLVAAVVVPAIVVIAYLYFDYWTKRIPPPEPGWDIFNAIVSIVAGGSTLLITLPVWFVTEKSFGGRAP